MGAFPSSALNKRQSYLFTWNNVQTNKTKDLLEVLKPSFGSVKELCKRISDVSLELAITPLAESGDYTAIQDAIFVMVELKKAFESIEPQH